ATIEVNPEIEDIDFKGIKLTKNIYTVEEEHVESQLKMIQTKQIQTQKIEEERPVQAKDTVLIDFEGFIDDKPLEQLPKTENFVIKIGESTIIKELDDALIGTQPGEHKDIPVTFPEDFQAPDLAGKNVLIKADIKEIREEILPDINDEFAKELGEKYETLEDLKADIRKNIEEGNAKRTEHELNEQIFTALLDQVEFEVPDIWVQNELDNMVADVERKFGNNREVMEQSGITREVIENEYRSIAVGQAQRHLILDKIINQEKLELADEKLEESYEDIAKQYQQPVEQIRTLYASKPEMVEFLRHTLLEKEALSLIFDNSTIEEMAQENTESEETAE
ncbi:trigger factor, partial [Desulfobacterales bacterium HSG16]|nr:trigger factor [Desulfobacterales bacterium HSG16]